MYWSKTVFNFVRTRCIQREKSFRSIHLFKELILGSFINSSIKYFDALTRTCHLSLHLFKACTKSLTRLLKKQIVLLTKDSIETYLHIILQFYLNRWLGKTSRKGKTITPSQKLCVYLFDNFLENKLTYFMINMEYCIFLLRMISMKV